MIEEAVGTCWHCGRGLMQADLARENTCPGCGNSVTAGEFIWESGATDPSRRVFACPRCRDSRADKRPVAVDPDDLYRARSVDPHEAREFLRPRFPAPVAGHELPDELVDLYPPRAQVALAAILERIETELRAPSFQAALRLAVVHMVLATSKDDEKELR